MKKTIIAIISSFVALSCTDEGSSSSALHDMGFTEVEFTGYSFFACSDDDTFRTGFRARNPEGRRVSGTVCCGLLKGCTVRF